ncbi:MAG: hypothetical protein ACE5E3_07075 [Mariprofundus sp.]
MKAETLEHRDRMSEVTTSQKLLLSEQVRIAYDAMGSSAAANLINSTILAWMLWPAVDHRSIVGWWLFIFTVTLIRGVDAFLYRKQGSDINASHWMARLSIGTYLGGFGWMVAAILLFAADSITHQVLLAFVVGGMAAGATVVLSTQWVPGIAYLIMLLVPMAVQFFRLDGDIALSMGVMSLLYLLILISLASKIRNNTLQNIRLRI